MDGSASCVSSVAKFDWPHIYHVQNINLVRYFAVNGLLNSGIVGYSVFWQSSFFASFMCFEVLPLNPHGAGDDDEKDEDDDISAMDMDGTDVKTSKLLILAIISLCILMYMCFRC